jgi:hypothetical protein
VNGVDGAVGPAGAAGVDGADGPVGADGADGADGAQGPVGVDGAVGPAGADGVDGATGPAGPQGPAGADGDPADIGYLQVTGPVSESGNPTSRTAIAVCPSGYFVVGGGFEIESSRTGNREPPFVTRSGPTSEPTQDRTWSVTVENGSITRTDWRIWAFAVCLAIPAP